VSWQVISTVLLLVGQADADRIVFCPTPLGCTPVLASLDGGVVASLSDAELAKHWPLAEVLYFHLADYQRLQRAKPRERIAALKARRQTYPGLVIDHSLSEILDDEEGLLRAEGASDAALARYRQVHSTVGSPRSLERAQRQEAAAVAELASLGRFAPAFSAELDEARADHAAIVAELARLPHATSPSTERIEHVYALPAVHAPAPIGGELRRAWVRFSGGVLVALYDAEPKPHARPIFVSADDLDQAHDDLPPSLFEAEVARRKNGPLAEDIHRELDRFALQALLLPQLTPELATRLQTRLQRRWHRTNSDDIRQQLVADLALLTQLAVKAGRSELAERLRNWPR